MKISVRNLGVINEAEIDLKPLTVLIGPNNAGKTWLAYTLAGILGYHGSAKYLLAYIDGKISDAYPSLAHAVEQVLNEGNAKIDMIQFADEYADMYFNNVAKLAPQWMREFMGTNTATFDMLSVNIDLSNTKATLLNSLMSRSVNHRLSFGQGTKALLSALKEVGKRELFIYTSTEGNITEKLPRRAIEEFLVSLVFQGIFSTLYEDVYIFPTERTTYITLPWNLTSIDEMRMLGETNQQERQTRSLQWPVYNFLFELMRSLYLSNSSVRENEAASNLYIAEYTKLALLLEQRVLEGNLFFSTAEPDPLRELFFKSGQGVTLDMPVVSSMVKELTPLVLYLRYLAQPGEWLIIDEPEMNLHPEAQVKLTEFLAMLVKAGLHVLITTHSPYIVDHLTNLMKAAESSEPDAIQDKFYLKSKDAFISKNEVSVYLVDHGTTENMLDEDGVVHWGTFGKVSDRVSEIYFEL